MNSVAPEGNSECERRLTDAFATQLPHSNVIAITKDIGKLIAADISVVENVLWCSEGLI